MSAEKYRCNVDKKGQKVSSIPRSILLYESIVDTDIDILKVSSIVSISISIFDINNPANVNRSKIKVTQLGKPSRSHGCYSDYSRHPVTLYCATCGRCQPGSACQYDCLCFLVLFLVLNLLIYSITIYTI